MKRFKTYITEGKSETDFLVDTVYSKYIEKYSKNQPECVGWLDGSENALIRNQKIYEAGIEDNDWLDIFNVNGAICARAVVSQRVPEGMSMMYHAQERILNMPGSELTGTRGGIHNSVTRVVMKPTHMIGGYAQQAYGFNYYGTVGCNRDEFVVVRKMDKVDFLDTE